MYATTCCFVVRTNEVATPTVPSPDGAPKVGVHSFIVQCNIYYIYVLLLSLVRNLVHAFLITLCHQDSCGI